MTQGEKREREESVVGSDAGEASKEAKIEPVAEEEPVCALCHETTTEENQLLPTHGCSTCKPGAWRICEDCDEISLGRPCPMCRGAYKPMPMFFFPRVEDLIKQVQTSGMPDGKPAQVNGKHPSLPPLLPSVPANPNSLPSILHPPPSALYPLRKPT